MYSFLKRTISLLAAATMLAVSPVALAQNLAFPTTGYRIAAEPRMDKNTYLVLVDKSTQVVSVLRRDKSKKYSIIARQMRCSTGSKPDFTPVGTFRISDKYTWRKVQSGQYVQYAMRIKGHIMIHSLSYQGKNASMLDAKSYADLGKPVSAGCVRLLTRDSKWIYDNCPRGTKVKIVDAGGPPVTAVVNVPALPEGQTWDPTDPNILRPVPFAANPLVPPAPSPANP